MNKKYMEEHFKKVSTDYLKAVKTYEINQSQLTSDCWLIQFQGISACATCEFKNTKECGGGQTLKQLKSN